MPASTTARFSGSSGEFPANAHDVEQAARFSSGGIHFARALERVAPAGDPDREHAEEALAVYLPRAVYVLFTMINKLDGLSLPQARRMLLEALLLHTCDMGSSLWDVSGERERPRQLSAPPRFYEHNLWLALEQAVGLFSTATNLCRLTTGQRCRLTAVESASSKVHCAS